MRTNVLVLALSLCTAPAFADKDDHLAPPPNLPAALEVPAGQSLVFAARGVGVQIYECVAQGGTYSWVFQAPSATLYHGDADADDRVIGLHFVGPTWADHHGSVVGAVAAKVASPTAGAIAWLRLNAVAHSGHGRFAKVSTVQRLDTVGGVAPTGGCDDTVVGVFARVPYQADYFFYKLDDNDNDDNDDSN